MDEKIKKDRQAASEKRHKLHGKSNDDDDCTTVSEFEANMAKLRGSSNDSINSDISSYNCNVFRDGLEIHSPRGTKRAKKTHLSPEIVVEIEDRKGDLVPIRALLDTGTTATILLKQFVRKGRAKSYKGKVYLGTQWEEVL